MIWGHDPPAFNGDFDISPKQDRNSWGTRNYGWFVQMASTFGLPANCLK